MNFNFEKGRFKFLYGFQDPNQVASFFEDTTNFVGMTFVGRSNVGKSSLINAYFGSKAAKTSKTPGRTRQINVFSSELNDESKTPFYFVDVPGYGFAQTSKAMSQQWGELMTCFFQQSPSSNLIVNIQDARHPDQKADRDFCQFLGQFPQLDTYLVFNKLDKLKKQKDRSIFQKEKKRLLSEYPMMKQIYDVSAQSGKNLELLENALINFLLDRNLNLQDSLETEL